MATVSITTPSDGQTIDASDVATPLNTIVTEINGNLDSNNIAEGGVVPNSLTDGTGTSWAWQSWTPTYNNLVAGNGTITAKYIQIGKTVHFRFHVVCGSTTALGNSITITYPVTPAAEYGTSRTVFGNIQGGDVGANNYFGWVTSNASTTNMILVWNDGTAGGATTFPFTETTGDFLTVTGTYEAA